MLLSLPLSLLGGLFSGPVADTIVPADDGTGTQVHYQPAGATADRYTPGDRYTITGGSQSSDGSNLFHSFDTFNINTGSTATFISPEKVENIFGRVVGGQGSFINGTLSLTGSDANLFLLNPAGILFAPGAQLDVPAAFTATTATGIEFDGGMAWNGATQNYGALLGNPQLFQFGVDPGSIINLGQLSVLPGARLSLLSGIVVNRGSLIAPGGQVVIAAVPDGQWLRLSAAGQVLSLELERSPALETNESTTNASTTPSITISPLSLGELLTGAGPDVAIDIQVNAAGQITLSGGDLSTPANAVTVQPGDAIASGQISAASTTGLGGTVAITGDRLIATAADIQATGPSGGGEVYLGGTFQGGRSQGGKSQGGKSQAPTGTLPNQTPISATRLFNSETSFIDRASSIDVSALDRGNGGTAIVWADGATVFDGAIVAQGGPVGGNGGFVEVSGRERLGFTGRVNVAALQGTAGQLLLDPRDVSIEDPNITGFIDGNANVADGTLEKTEGGTSDLSITPTAIEIALLTGDVTIQASRNIGVNGAIATATANSLSLEADENVSVRADITLNGGNLNLQGNSDNVGGGAVVVENGVTLATNGGNISASGVASTNAFSTSGVNIMGSTLNAGTDGSIVLDGAGNNLPASNEVEGVMLTNSTLTAAGLGTIRIDGVGGTGSALNDGITIEDSMLNTDAGEIRLTGTGGEGGRFNDGVELERSQLTTQTGSIVLTGTMGGMTDTGFGNRGVFLLDSNLTITADSQDITITGTGGSATGVQPSSSLEQDNHTGVAIVRTSITASPTGNLVIEGQGGTSAGVGNLGVFINGDGELQAPGGAITITGRGGTSIDGANTGIEILGQAGMPQRIISGGPGGITLDGRGGTGSEAGVGIRLQQDVVVQADSGPLTLTGQRGGTGPDYLYSVDSRAEVQLNAIANNLNVQSLSGPIHLERGVQAGGAVSIVAPNTVTINGGITAGGAASVVASDIVTISDSVTAGGAVSILVSGNANIRDVTAGQNITVRSTNAGGNLSARNIEAQGPGSRNVELSSQGTLTVETVSTQNNGGTSGSVVLDAQDDLSFNAINSVGATGGNITLNSANGNIYGFGTLSGAGCDGTTLCTNGAISINHGGLSPFTVGNVAASGTVGTIRSNTVTLALGEVIPNNPGTFTNGSITVTPGGAVPAPAPTPTPTPDPDPKPTPDPSLDLEADPADLADLLEPLEPQTEPAKSPVSVSPTPSMSPIVIPDLLETVTRIPISLLDGGNSESSPGLPPAPSPDFGFPLTPPLPDQNEEVNQSDNVADGDGHVERVSPLLPEPLPEVLFPDGEGGVIIGGAIAENPSTESFPGHSPPTTAPLNPALPGEPSGLPEISEDTIALDIDLLVQREADSGLSLPNFNLSTGYDPSIWIDEINGATSRLEKALAEGDTRGALSAADELFTLQFADYLELDSQTMGGLNSRGDNDDGDGQAQNNPEGDGQLEELRDGEGFTARVEQLLETWGDRTGKGFAILYPIAFPDRLELLLITGRGQTIRETVAETNQSQLKYLIGQLRREVTDPFARESPSHAHSYRPIAQRLRQYLITPVETALQAAEVDSLLIAPGPLLRSVPYGALMKGDRFLIQDYGLTVVPSFQNIESYLELSHEGEVLAMGASTFTVDQQQQSLPYASAEALAAPQIFGNGGTAFTNEEFTEATFVAQRQQNPYRVVHLATHANFRDGGVENSYIQFWNEQLSVSDLGRLSLGSPTVDLLILSACRTAVGSAEAELGFAGLTVKAGARTAIASQWEVNDRATMILMTYFYHFFNDPNVTTKAEALQRAQLFLLENPVEISSDRELMLPDGQTIALPDTDASYASADAKLSDSGDRYDLAHPFYWAAFTAIGSPW
ncbi:MAG: CHAT domain-containing protein [Cyanophyceae cyanobacterium]